MDASPDTPLRPHAAASHPAQRRVSLVIGARDDANTIARAISEAADALGQSAADYEIVVVDDASADGTADIVLAAARENDRVRLIRLPVSKGYGAALRAGLAAARFELVATLDPSGRYDPADLADVIPLAERHDMVAGEREGGAETPASRLCSFVFNTLARLLLGPGMRDPLCGLRVYRRTCLAAIAPESSDGFAPAEMLSTARKVGLSVVNVSVSQLPPSAAGRAARWRERCKTTGSLLRHWWLRELFPSADNERVGGRAWFWFGLVLLALVAGLQLFSNLHYPLFEPDEGRYAEIAREMLSSGDWIVPRFYGGPYLDKPPLFYWLLAGSFRLFGVQDSSARLVPATAAWLTILATFFFVSRALGARRALMAGLALVLSLGFVVAGRFLILDSLLTLWVALALFTAREAIQGRRLRWGWWCASAVCCALGLLTKGPVALVLLAPPVFAYGWLMRSPGRPRFIAWCAYLALVAAIAGPWYAAMVARIPKFAVQFLWNHHVLRFFEGVNHPEPTWYYVPVLLLAGLPCSLVLVSYLRFQFSRRPETAVQRPRASGFFLLWAAWCLAFFSAASCKLPPYILPAFPALAVLFGVYLDHLVFSLSRAAVLGDAGRRRARFSAAVVCLGGVLITWSGWLLGTEAAWETFCESALFAGALAGVWFLGRKIPSPVVWAVCGAAVFFVTFEANREIVPAWADSRSPLPDAGQAAEQLLREPGVHVIVYGHEWGSVPFYLNRDDVEHFDVDTLDRLTKSVRKHERTLLVYKREQNIDAIRKTLGPEMEISAIGDAGRASLAVVERRGQAARVGGKRRR
ncbi:MAG: phospholipid carrier-dependent glycosyltransferase [Planctomycetia bacterium]|nr:phospholipid carrier-dependent glycosyltransferase [Planctomycetia bacterium]